MQPGDHGPDGDQPVPTTPDHPVPDDTAPDHTQVLPTVPADAPPTYTQRSDAETTQLPEPPPVYAPPPPAEPTTELPTVPPYPYGAQPYAPPAGYGQTPPVYGQPTYQETAYQQPYQETAYQPPAYGAPVYSQPSYQQPGYPPAGYPQPGYQEATTAVPTPPKKSRTGLWIAAIVVIVIAALIGILFAVKPSPLFKKVLNHSAVEQTIQSQSANGHGDYTRVSCPSNEEVKAGTTFECTAAGGKRITVRIVNKNGDYVWSPAN